MLMGFTPWIQGNSQECKKLDEIDYEEMLELSSLGAQVMHSRSIELGQKYGISIYVGLSNSDIKGTVIKEVATKMNMESKPITGLATSDDDVAITIRDIDNDINLLSDIFESVAKRINIDMISQTAL